MNANCTAYVLFGTLPPTTNEGLAQAMAGDKQSIKVSCNGDHDGPTHMVEFAGAVYRFKGDRVTILRGDYWTQDAA